MRSDRRGPGFIDTRLDTWKSIAQHLGRSSRTVQRWHREYGLPVRHLGGEASSVFAYTDELDQWLRDRDANPAHRSLQSEASSSLSFQAPSVEEVQTGAAAQSSLTHEFGKRRAAELICQGQRLWQTLSSSNLGNIARTFREATDLDASNPLAFAGLSQALIAQVVLGKLHPSGALHTAEAALRKATEIDPNLFEAKCAWAMLKILLERDWNGARRLLDEALLDRPNISQALVGRALLSVAENSLADASEFLRQASSECPLNSSVAELLCWVEYLSGRFDSTLAIIADARDTGHSGAILDTVEELCGVFVAGPNKQIERLETLTAGCQRNEAMLGVLGFAYGQVERTRAARDVTDSLTRLGLTGTYDFAYPIALTLLGLKERAEAIKWLEQSYAHGSLWSLGFGSDPMLVDLRRDPAYRSFFGDARYPGTHVQLESKQLTSFVRSPMPFSA